MQTYRIRRFADGDEQAVSALIARTLRTTNAKDYTPAYIERSVAEMSPAHIRERAGWTHFYVACDGDALIGCGAIGSYWGSLTESSLFTIFVLPEYQGRGVGRAIVQALEQDEYALRASRIEIPASITGRPFYEKMGYACKPGQTEPDGEQLYRMEKFR